MKPSDIPTWEEFCELLDAIAAHIARGGAA